MPTSQRPTNPSRRASNMNFAAFVSSLQSKYCAYPYVSYGILALAMFLVFAYFYGDSGGLGRYGRGVEGDYLCNLEVQRTIPFLKKAYGDSMHRVLHVGPDTCSVVSTLLSEEDTEAWGVEPYDIEDADPGCQCLVHRGIVRVADIKFPLPYRAKSFSLVIVSDALDYLSPKYLNRTLPDLARVSSDGLIVYTGYPRHLRNKLADKSKFGKSAKLRSSTWWVQYFVQTSLEENEVAVKKFEQAAAKAYYTPRCQIFHLKSYH